MQQLAKFRPSVKVQYTVLNSVTRNLAAFKIFKVSGGREVHNWNITAYIFSKKKILYIHNLAYSVQILIWIPSQKFLDDHNQTVKEFFKAMDKDRTKEVPTSVFRKALKVIHSIIKYNKVMGKSVGRRLRDL